GILDFGQPFALNAQINKHILNGVFYQFHIPAQLESKIEQKFEIGFINDDISRFVALAEIIPQIMEVATDYSGLIIIPVFIFRKNMPFLRRIVFYTHPKNNSRSHCMSYILIDHPLQNLRPENQMYRINGIFYN